jgi:hypothetical protein
MLLKVNSDLDLADGRKFVAGDVIEVTVTEARLLLQKHSTKLQAIYKDKAKHAPSTDKFNRKVSGTHTK